MSTKVFGTLGADPTLPDVRLTIGGVERKLSFGFDAIARVENTTGINLMTTMVSTPSFTQLRAILFAALLADDPSLTLEQVGQWIKPWNVSQCILAVQTAWLSSQPETDDDAEQAAQGEETASGQ